MRHAVIFMPLCLLLAVALAFGDSAATMPSALPTTPQPVPKYNEQAKAEHGLREKFKPELANRDPGDRLALAHKFHQMATASTDPANKFVLFRLARDCAVNAGEFQYAMAIIDDAAKAFTIDVEEMKASALSIGFDVAAGDRMNLAVNYLKVADDALAVGNPSLASKAAFLAHQLARGNPTLLADTDARDKAAKLLKHELLDLLAAQKKLERNPDDAPLNYLLGSHLCFHFNRWENGLHYLAKSPAGKLKDLAVRDLAAPRDPNAMASLADEWWQYSDPKGQIPLGAGHGRAVYWYGKALAGLTGEKKAEAEKRIAETNQPPAPR